MSTDSNSKSVAASTVIEDELHNIDERRIKIFELQNEKTILISIKNTKTIANDTAGTQKSNPVEANDRERETASATVKMEADGLKVAEEVASAEDRDGEGEFSPGVIEAQATGVDIAENLVPSPTDEDWRLTQVRLKALEKHVVGMSFSGGGIRSGTFAVGFLQGLAQVGLLRRVDYLSTVSGGGYAGAWLAAWLKRDGDPQNVELQLNPNRVIQGKAERAMLPPGPGETGARIVDEEPTPLHHLRQFSSYLTPRPGLLTADTWTVIAIWLRNVSVNLFMMLLPMAMIVVLLARIIINAYAYLSPGAIEGDDTAFRLCGGLCVLGLGLLIFAVYRNAEAIGEFRQKKSAGDYRIGDAQKRPRVAGDLRRQLLWPLICAGVLLSVPLRAVIWELGNLVGDVVGGPRLMDSFVLNALSDYINAKPGLLDLPNLALHGVVLGVMMGTCALIVSTRNGIPVFGSGGDSGGLWKYASSAFIAGVSAGVLIPLLEALIRSLNDVGRPELAATVVPPLALLIIVAGFFVEVALLGRSITEAEREWWSRLSALLLIASLLWATVLASIVYVPAAFLAAGPALRTTLASGWLITTALGIVSGKRAQLKVGSGNVLGKIATVAPPIFLVGFLGAVGLFAAYLVNMPPLALPNAQQDWTAADRYFLGLKNAPLLSLVGWLMVFLVLYWLGNKRLDVNLFSLHAMYANRLVRCYLGASRPKARWAERWGKIHDPSAGGGAASLKPSGGNQAPSPNGDARTEDLKKLHDEGLTIVPSTPGDVEKLAENLRARRKLSIEIVQEVVDQPVRDANPETGFDPSDDIPLFDLGIGRKSGERTYWGPQLLINSTLNLVGGEELAWQDRKGESFILTPEYCGSKGVGYAKMTDKTRENLTLGRAITISGAAVDPNMSFYQSGALTAFLTIFNARLGQWMQNPRFPHWSAEGPKFGDRLVAELFGSTDDKDAFVHLSDGGHFENLGVYELIRRRCRYIIAVDAGEDNDASDDNLAKLTRLCRIDFGVRIELDTDPLMVEKPNAFTRTHVVVGRVHYEDVDSGQVPGIIVYIKTSLTGDEPSDVMKYAKKDSRFPHQPTDLRQSFTDEQFESYRALGDHIARDVFSDAVRRVRDTQPWETPRNHSDYIRGNQRFFSALRSRWTTAPPDHDGRYIQSTAAWTQFQRDIRKEPALALLSQDLYPELPTAMGTDQVTVSESLRQRAELHAVSQMIQLMENAWINLRLKGHSDLPMDHRWMNVFRRWTGTKAFHRLWPMLRSEFSPEFVKFCESRLRLKIGGIPCHQYFDANDNAMMELQSLCEEFQREWPSLEPYPTRGLTAMAKRALKLKLKMGDSLGLHSPVWMLYQSPTGSDTTINSPDKFPCGVVLLAPSTEDEIASRQAVSAPPHPEGVFELLVWVRRPHRSTGLASRAFLSIREALKAGLEQTCPGNSFALTLRYPRWNDEGDQELTMWKDFFALYDFKPLRETEADCHGARWTIMEHRFKS